MNISSLIPIRNLQPRFIPMFIDIIKYRFLVVNMGESLLKILIKFRIAAINITTFHATRAKDPIDVLYKSLQFLWIF